MAISITPDKLEFDLQKNESASHVLLVKNLGPEPTRIEVSVGDERWDDLIVINPQDIVLAPQAEAEITVLADGEKDFKTELEILSIPGENAELQIASGIKIPLSVNVPNAANNSPLFVSLILAFAVVAFMYHRRKTRPS